MGRWPLLRGLGDHFLVVLQQQTHPLIDRRVSGPITAAPVVADVNGDGVPEIVLAAGSLNILDAKGADVRGWPRRLGAPLASTPAVVAEGDAARIYVGSDDDGLHGLTFEGRRIAAFPYRTGGDVFSSPWAGSLDGSASLAVVFGSDDGGIHALDSDGRPLPGWPVRTGGFVSASPAPARVDGGHAVVIGSWDRKLYAVDRAGANLPGWPQDLDFAIWGTAAVADIDGDGWAEIAVATHKVHAFRGDGSRLEGFPARLEAYSVASPAIGDIDGDGDPEIVACADRVYAFRADGSSVPGFPVDVGSYIWASPVLVDVDGDGLPEIVVGDFTGNLWAVTGEGRIAAGFPNKIGRRITAAATAADVDGDKYLELLAASTDGRLVVLPTECPDDPARAPWPVFRGRQTLDAPEIQPQTRGSSLRVMGAATELQSEAEARQARPAPAAVAGVHLVPRLPRPFRPNEVRFRLPEGSRLEGGMLNYTLDGRVHPSPVLAHGGSYFALVQPLPPLKPVKFHLELSIEDAGTTRVPEQGSFVMRIGLPGLRLKG